jgi:glycerophosphoryl diester phosphodiesterase
MRGVAMILDTPLIPVIGAHRGASGEAPENTLAAFDLAIEQGAELLELDVHRTRDGHLVVHHDFTLNRTAGHDGQIAELSLAELRSYDVGAWRGPAWAGLTVPTLDEVLDRYAGRVLFNVEIKAARPPYPEIEVSVAAAIRARGLIGAVVVSSFNLPTMERLCRVAPDIRAGLLAEEQPDAALERACELGAVALHLDSSLITAPRVQRTHARRLGLLAWTVDDPVEMVRVIDLGADAVISNYPARLRDVVLARRAAS